MELTREKRVIYYPVVKSFKNCGKRIRSSFACKIYQLKERDDLFISVQRFSQHKRVLNEKEKRRRKRSERERGRERGRKSKTNRKKVS